ncbi:hypothetical protein D0192_01800 [Salmonella enterica subsp. enterica serovar Muenster]|nr:hypothetical protein [Salmonella enterica subsp. enterica serovar Muenster]
MHPPASVESMPYYYLYLFFINKGNYRVGFVLYITSQRKKNHPIMDGFFLKNTISVRCAGERLQTDKSRSQQRHSATTRYRP